MITNPLGRLAEDFLIRALMGRLAEDFLIRTLMKE